ncbi:hypothetical protein [Desulfovibrio ferrophilus]|uniref:Uncharacterized protein n=1 Tax=Desulfovibrio ferrophilus TaxID=241368 RepID=A0A2Z6B0W5_9BACT|nr:hypothetical protein [Desulfovibrio ferrophilus]BBD09088.1 uncharacterized protein DFE_2362 [Desulfovibrio ferrophilus]
MKRNRTGVFRRLEALYARMQQAYDTTVGETGFTCQGCENNCCTSYFQHHTYVEWSFLFKGLDDLPAEKREQYMTRAQDYVHAAQDSLNKGERPSAMCPLNDDGLCGLYRHRLMICRLHGVPHVLAGRMGQLNEYPGCFRFPNEAGANPLDRTPLYRELAKLEMDFLGSRMARLPKVNLTLAEMMVQGPPKLTT